MRLSPAAIFLLILIVILTSCSGLKPIVPPARPTEDEIVTNYGAFTQKFGNLPPSDYVKMGYRTVDENCDLFFQQLAQAGRSYDFLKRETVLSIATTSVALALLHNSAQTLALVAAGGALLSGTIDNIEDYALLTHYTNQLKAYVDQARNTFKQTNDPSLVGDNKFAADDYVRQYANICTIDGLEQTIAQSIANSVAVPGDITTQALSRVAADVQRDLGGTLPTVDDLRSLVKLLDPSATAARKQASALGAKFNSANGVYWDKAKFGLLPPGISIQVKISAALALMATQPTLAPSAPAPTLSPLAAPAAALLPAPLLGPGAPASKSYATPLVNVPKS